MEEYEFDNVIIGAGVIGLALGVELSKFGNQVLIIEKKDRPGEEISSRNSGVIHGGMYYSPNSLKAKFCVSGNRKLYSYCSKKNIKFERTGKLIISSNKNEHKTLQKILTKGLKNNVELEMLNQEEVKSLENEINCYSAILSPNTGLLDVPEFINSLENDFGKNGGLIIYNLGFESAKKEKNKFKIKTDSEDNFYISSKNLINCSGLDSEKVANGVFGIKKKFIKKVYYGKGHYYKYHGKNPFKKLIYPVPSKASLGIHASWDFSNQLKFGPDLCWSENISYKFEKDLKKKFFESIQSYWGSIDKNKLHPDYVGVRPKIHSQYSKQEDFFISLPKEHGLDGFYNLQGIESPGLTSSLAISEYLSKIINHSN